MSAAHMAEDIEALRLHLKLDTFFALLGHSHGTCVVQEYAAKYPSRVEKILLIAAALIGSQYKGNARLKFLEARADHPTYKQAIPGMAKAYAAQNDEELTAGMSQLMPYYFAHPDSPSAREWLDAIAKGTVSFWAWKANKAADAKAATPNLPVIRAKTLIVLGNEDPVCTEAWAEEIRNLIPGSKLVVFKDCGHMPWHEADDFWPAMFDFLKA